MNLTETLQKKSLGEELAKDWLGFQDNTTKAVVATLIAHTVHATLEQIVSDIDQILANYSEGRPVPPAILRKFQEDIITNHKKV